MSIQLHISNDLSGLEFSVMMRLGLCPKVQRGHIRKEILEITLNFRHGSCTSCSPCTQLLLIVNVAVRLTSKLQHGPSPTTNTYIVAHSKIEFHNEPTSLLLEVKIQKESEFICRLHHKRLSPIAAKEIQGPAYLRYSTPTNSSLY